MGLNVGDAVGKGALVRLFSHRETAIERHLSLSPFPRSLPPDVVESEFNQRYRHSMITNAGIAVFIAGTSRSAAESVGVLQEFEIAKQMGRIPIPVGCTGFAAKRIWETINKDLQGTYRGAVSQRLFERLNTLSLSNDEIIDAIFKVIDAITEALASAPVPLQRRSRL